MVWHLKLEATSKWPNLQSVWIFLWNNELLCFSVDELSQRALHSFLWRCEAALFSRVMFFRDVYTFLSYFRGWGMGEEEQGEDRGVEWDFEGVRMGRKSKTPKALLTRGSGGTSWEF